MLGKEVEGSGAAWKDLDKSQPIFRGLPLEKCSFERNQVTGELGWRAPGNYSFKVTGQFRVNSDQSDAEFGDKPQESLALFKATHEDLYKAFLKEASGDEKLAFELLVSHQDCREDQFPEFFMGKWFVMSPNLDGSASFIAGQKPTLMVKSNVEAWYDQDVFMIAPNVAVDPKTSSAMDIFFDSPVGIVFWRQYQAEVMPNVSRVELVAFQEQESELFIPKPVNRNLQLPLGVILRKV